MNSIKLKILPCLLYAVYCLLFVALSSCDPNRVFEDNTDIPDFAWDVKNKLSFDVNIEDTTALHNLYVNVRHASHYPYANLFVFITIEFPNGKLSKDTLECKLADEAGQWKGEGMGEIWDNQILWKPNVKFPLTGTYHFEYEQAMREEQVPFIMDVGLRVEKAKKK
ncbi:MAG: gliding motility lipoprotein GldH [Bacteroidetes bacterium]|nr:MAG: gliding motility lipoprotein GldH [Bacteroidota bacterium]